MNQTSSRTQQQLSQVHLAEARLTAVRGWPGINYVGVLGFEFIFRKAGYEIGKAVTFHVAEIGVYRRVRGNTDRAGHHSMRNLRALDPALIRVTAHDGPYFTVECLESLPESDSGLCIVEGDPQPGLFEDQAAALAEQLEAAAIAGAIEFNRAGGEDAANPGFPDDIGAIELNRADAPCNSNNQIPITTDNPICARPSQLRDNGTGAIELNRAGQPLPSRTAQLARKQRQDAETQASDEPSHVIQAVTRFLDRGPRNVAAEKAHWESRIRAALNDPSPNGDGAVSPAVIAFLAGRACGHPKDSDWLANVLEKMVGKYKADQAESQVTRRRAYLCSSYKKRFPAGLETD